MAKEKAAASALAAALVLAAACQCQYPRAARSAALVLAARGSAAGRVGGGLCSRNRARRGVVFRVELFDGRSVLSARCNRKWG